MKTKNLWRLWKKGALLGIVMALIGLVVNAAIGANLLDFIIPGQNWQTIGVIFIITALVVAPIIYGWLIEWVNKLIKK